MLRLRALEALRSREFRLLYGQVFTPMAPWLDSIARGRLIYGLTDSSFQLGLVRGVQAISTSLLSLVARGQGILFTRMASARCSAPCHRSFAASACRAASP